MNSIHSYFPIKPILLALFRNKTGPLLVALQIALSLAILSNAIYLVNQRLTMAARPSGIAQEQDVFYLHISNQRAAGHEEQLAMQKREEQVMRTVPGVLGVARTNSMPMSQSGSSTNVASQRDGPATEGNAAMYVSPGSLIQVLGLRLTEGRDFSPQDVVELDQNAASDLPPAVIITQAMGKLLFPDASAYLGKEFFFGRGPGANSVRIIGVVETMQTSSAMEGVTGEISALIPVRLSNDAYSGYVLRAAPGQRDRVMQQVEQALRKDSVTSLNIRQRTADAMREGRYRHAKGLSWMLLAVCGLLILVTASGIVGMCSLVVNQRKRQIGVRRALGATRLHILLHFLTENALISLFGAGMGCVLALALNQFLVQQLEIAQLPLMYLGLSVCVFLLLGIAAAWAPAWRAAGIAPATATRSV
ncbi:MAG: ABC transporter permease [Undibacterium curvum]|uniref:ABC transporter permease n=1 Tax=Undibacterium curvum TaxID=2762294 RepID=UPI003BC1454B